MRTIRALEEEIEELNTRLIMWQHNQGHDPMALRGGDGAQELSPDQVRSDSDLMVI